MSELKTAPEKDLKAKASWVKQLYFYLVVAVSILFLAIGLFTFSRAILLKFVFTKADSTSYYTYPSGSEEQCKYVDSDPYTTRIIKDPSSNSYNRELNTPEDKKICEEKIKKAAEDQKEGIFQQDMLNSILMIVISSIVLGIHLKFVRLRE